MFTRGIVEFSEDRETGKTTLVNMINGDWSPYWGRGVLNGVVNSQHSIESWHVGGVRIWVYLQYSNCCLRLQFGQYCASNGSFGRNFISNKVLKGQLLLLSSCWLGGTRLTSAQGNFRGIRNSEWHCQSVATIRQLSLRNELCPGRLDSVSVRQKAIFIISIIS
jgi:hypothetical protein